jgi:hypothetical protein
MVESVRSLIWVLVITRQLQGNGSCSAASQLAAAAKQWAGDALSGAARRLASIEQRRAAKMQRTQVDEKRLSGKQCPFISKVSKAFS